MTPREEDAYINLKQHLALDLLNIDEHLMRLPMLQMEASEYASDAARFAGEYAAILRNVTSEAAQALRSSGEKKPSEAEINSRILTDEVVMNATADLAAAEYDKDRWRALVDSFKSKMSAMRISGELIVAGYLAPRAVVSTGRESIHAQRQARQSEWAKDKA